MTTTTIINRLVSRKCVTARLENENGRWWEIKAIKKIFGNGYKVKRRYAGEQHTAVQTKTGILSCNEIVKLLDRRSRNGYQVVKVR